MSYAPLESMTLGEIQEYVESLETENRSLRAATDNRKKLSASDADRIRELYANGAWTQADLAHAFDVNPSTVNRIINNVYYAE